MGMVHSSFFNFFYHYLISTFYLFCDFLQFVQYQFHQCLNHCDFLTICFIYNIDRSYFFLPLVLDGLFLHNFCTENKQCTGTENANICTTYGNKTLLTCRCSDEYMEIKSKCYKSKISIPSYKALKVFT